MLSLYTHDTLNASAGDTCCLAVSSTFVCFISKYAGSLLTRHFLQYLRVSGVAQGHAGQIITPAVRRSEGSDRSG